jgi:hypothetical protein
LENHNSLVLADREAVMPHYYFHLRSNDHLDWDEDGVDLPDLRTVYGAASRAAEELWRDVFHSMTEQSGRMIVVTDEAGQLVLVVHI